MMNQTLDLLTEWVAIPSFAGNQSALRTMAGAITSWLRHRLGAEIIAAPAGLVHARIDGGHSNSILLYNMYDVMPATPQGWSVPPFAGGIVGDRFIGRGAENNKGPLAGMLVALEALLQKNRLAANIEILIEGEEETGSLLLRRYLADAARPIRRCRTALFPSFMEYGGGPPRIYLGSKGIAHGIIRTAGPSRTVHSSNISWMDNPAWTLVTALAAATSARGAAEFPEDARPLLAALAETFDPDTELRWRGAPGYSVPGSTHEKLRTVLTAVSLNLASLATDPPAARAVIPTSAQARFDLRLPPCIDPQSILAGLQQALPSVEMIVEDVYPGHRFPASAPGVAALDACYRAAGVTPQIWPWAIGAAPAYAFANVADSFLMGGLGHAGNAHGIDEFVTLAGLERFLSFMVAWLPATARSLAEADEHDGP